MPEIQIIAKDSHDTLSTIQGTSAKLSEASVVLVKVAASDVLVVNREGTNAVIRLKNGETIVIEGFFSGTAEPKDNSLVFQDENGQLIWAKFKDAENDADADADADADSDVEPQALVAEDLPAALPAETLQELVSDVIYQPISSIEPLLYHDAGVNPWLWAAIPLVAGGIIAAASNSDNNDDSTPIDNTPPATPAVPSGYLDNVGADQGIKGSGSSTDDTTPGVVISAPGAGETPALYVDGVKVSASYDPVTGTLTPTTPLADGSHQLTYTLTDAAGNESAPSPALTVTVDTLAPATPAVPSGYLDNVGADQGIKGSGSSTDDTTPGVVISAPGAGETPALYVDGVKVPASYDPVTGTLTPTTPLADGSHQLTYTLTDAAGNESAPSPALTVTVDTLAPATPAVPSGYLDNVGADQGIKGSGSSTDDTTPGVVISAPGSGETPALYVDGVKVPASYDPVTGTLTPTTPLADGSHQLTYTLTDAAGNESAQSPALTVTVDTLAPATPAVPSGYLDNVGADQGIKGSGSSTDDTTPGVVISAPGAGETPALYVDGVKVPASYDPVTGTLTPTTPLADGSHQLTYTLTDAAGNESAQSPALTVTVDTLAPATPAVPSGYLDNVGADQGIKGSGSSTDDTTPGVVISAPGAGETPALYVDGVKVPASYDPVTGTLTPTTPLADGSHQLTYTLTDAAGNESAPSPALTVTVDTLAPAPVITIDPVTNAITIDFGEAVNAVDGSPLTADALEGLLDIANGTLTDLLDNGDGSFSGTLVPAADFEGDVVVNVPAGIVTDVAGNANLTATESFTVDTLAPAFDFTVTINADGTATIAGSTEPSATVEILDPAGNPVAVTVAPDGTISGSIAAPALAGDYTGTATDVNGNPATDTATAVDTTAPAFDFTVTINADGTATIAGSTEPGATVEILDPAGNPVAVTVAPDGTISGSIAAPALAGDYTGTATDVNGNPATDTATAVDTTAPAFDFTVTINADGTATIAGSTEPGATVEILDPAGNPVAVTVAPDGTISGSIAAPALAGDYTGTATDVNGNPATDTATAVDTTAPAFDFTVTINADGTATIAGSTEPGATVEILDPAGNPVAVTVAPDGTISGSIAAPALAGDYTGTATDVNGNPATDTATAVDTTAPAFDFTVTINADGTATIAGSTEPGATVEILDPAGNPVAVTVAPDGTISGSIAAPALAGDYTGTATDVNGNPATDTATAVDTTAPAFDFTVTINADGTATIAGSTEPGATVEILDPAGNPVAVTVAPDGTISGSIAAPALAGDYTGTATDVNGNPATDTATAVDTTAPAFDFTVTINADGTATIAGSTEPGATVEILDPAGNPVAVTVAPDGTISGSIAAPALAGDYTGTATDVNGNPATDTATAVDTTAPAFDFTVTINADGTATIAGSTEPGATVEILDPAGNPVAVTVAPDGTISGSIAAPALAGDYTGTATDVNGNPATDTATAVDTTAPAFDFTVTINADGTATIAGSTEPGATVEILDPAGNPVAVTVAPDGTISGSIAAPALAGDYTGTATDVNGNPATDTATAVDTTAPAFDFTVTINADGTATIAGSTEPGATVEILDPAGNPVAVTVAPDGTISGSIAAPALAGDYTGTATDVNGNPATDTATAVDTTAPAFDFTVTINADGTATIAGSTEPGATVEILDPAGNPVAVTVAPDGTISGSIAAPALAGDYTGTATDVNGNPATDTATAVDTTAPAFDFTVTINADGTATIAGSTEPGATVEILDPAGNPVAVTVAPDGTISGSIAAPALAGDYTGTATDVNGNPATDTATAVDTTAPAFDFTVTINADGTATIAGSTEPGATVEILDPAGNPVAVTVAPDGTISGSIAAPALAGDYTGTATDVNGNPATDTATAVDTTAPAFDFTVTINADGTATIAGSTEPGATVEILDPAGNPVAVTVAPDGTISGSIAAPALAGDYTGTATDVNGNPATDTATAVDTTAPAFDFTVTINADGTATIAGSTEPGATVEILDPAGNPVAVTVAPDGTISGSIAAPALAGDYTGTATDVNGNPATDTATAVDTTAPAFDFTVTINADGTATIAGSTEPGATVEILDPAGNPVAVTVAPDGTISGSIAAPALAGDYTGTATDVNGNPATDTATAVDTTAPAFDFTVTINADGTATIAGSTEPGATVEILDPAGNPVAVTVAPDGTISGSIAAPALAGDYTGTATDVNGNPATDTATAVDTTAPAFDFTVTINADGTATIAGSTEPGATVEILDPAGNPVAVTVAPDGTISGSIAAPALAGDYTGTATDVNGNPATDTATAVDTTAPAFDFTVTINADGTATIAGSTEPGATVEILDPAGNPVAVTVAPDGTISGSIAAPALAGDYTGTATDVNGNPATDTATAVDTTAPAFDFTVTINADGTATIAGSTEPGATVEILDPAGNPVAVTVAPDGTISGSIAAPALAGDYTGTATDVNGNPATDTATAVDTTAPAFDFTVTINADGTATIAGSTEPGATVEILDPAGNPVAVTVAPDGTISGSIAAPALAGDYTGTATDVNGNPATDTATAVDTTAPAFDFTVTINADGTATIAGSTEPGATVEILDPAGNPVAVTVAPDGTISGSIAAPALAGDYTGTATDVNGNPATDTATAVDTTAPAFDFTVTINADGTATIAGSTEPGATVEILDPAGNPVAVTVAPDGTISGSIAAPALAGDYTGTATDVNGNPATDTATAVDTTAPAFDFTVTINADGTATIAGSTEPGATVEILDPAGNPVAVTVAPDGTISGSIAAPALAGDYTGTATDVNGNPATDTATAVALDTIDAINDNVTFDPGPFVSTIWDAPIIAQDINVLDTSIIGDTSMNVEFSVPRNSADIGTGHEGDVVIQVSQDNLIAVASGFSVLVEYFDGTNWVQYTTATTTNGGLIADALGLGVLGIVDDGKTIAVHLTGVPEGQYRVVVQNDSSAIGDLLDDLTLAELGDQGILLGADNQDAVLDAVETALNGQVLTLGTLVRNVLEPLLNAANAAGETLAVTDIVAAIVQIPLVGSLLGGVDTVLDFIADALVDNLLTVLEFTNVTINGSETYYTTPELAGNVFADNGSGADDRGNSNAALVTKVDGVDIPTDGTDAVIKGLYGTLYINKDGVYRYVLNGSVDSNGQVDDFTYTLSDGIQSDTAVLTISVADVIAPKAPIVSSLDETTVTGFVGAAEADSIINVYGGIDSDGDGIPDTLLGITTANPDGSYTVTLNPAIALGDTVVVTSRDAAGNISTPTIASLHNIVALDDPNETNYELSTTADRPDISGGIFTLANAGVLGDLIDLDLSATSAPGVTVGTNEQITLTLTASGSTGLDISAVGNLIDAILGGNIGGSLDLIIAKETSTGSYEVYNTVANAYTLNNSVLTFTASGSQSISLDDAGVYKFILAPNSSTSSALSNLLSLNLLGNLVLSSNDVVATINNTDLITGNVLSNDTTAPIGLDLSVVSIKETTVGVDENVISGTPKVIEGMYGTLTIDSTGAYSYQMTANATALGKVEAFTYTVQDNDGHSKQATIYIRLDSSLVTLDWTDKIGLEEADKLVTQLTADNKASAGTVTTLFDQVLNGSSDSLNSIQVTGSNGALPTSPPATGSTAIPDDSGRFTLGAGQTAYISFTSILPSNVTQNFGLGGNQTSAYNVVIELERDGAVLDTQLATWTSTISGTKYYYKVTNTGTSSADYDLNIAYGDGSGLFNWTNTTGKTFGINNIQLDITGTTYTASTVSGDLISNDTLYSSVFKIGVAAGSTTPSTYLDVNSTPIVGTYGTLTVNLDGTYSYQANGEIADLGKDDVFTYKIETLDGTVNTQTLTIKVDADNVLIGTPNAGTAGNDIAVSQSTNEVFTLGDGADLLIYNVLNGSSPTGGNGTDQWLDFNMSEGDKIDVSSLLSGATATTINNYLSVTISGNQVTLLVDRDGSGSASSPTTLLTLTNEEHATNPITSLVDLLNNNSIIY
ncbi:Ig-like domain-containing protein [Acinetobacter pittii]|uniref:Ig-like domain-containing protein n=7 Tax=Acinetobacter TaxID=469 RepID=UPI002469113D|nr:Ig-like domain-containing protein [Acinetobacter pittii]WGM25548.1 Ig-like domain-containing protein [Acinetobacter pittii]